MRIASLLIGGFSVAWLTPTSATLAAAVREAQETLPVPDRHVFAVSLAGISLWQCFLASVLVIVGLVLRRVVIQVLERYREMEKPALLRLDERLIKAVLHPLGFAVALLFALGAEKVLLPQASKALDDFATNLIISIFIVDAAWLLFSLADTLAAYLERFAQRPNARLDTQLVPFIRKSLKVIIVIIAGVQIVQQMGGDIKALLTGLGIGGLAFALAARESIANIFGSIVILADRPFRVGDWIEAQGQNIEGVVEEVGFRSTRIRTFSKSLITVPNSVVANWAINNLSAMPRRRVKATIRVSPEATPNQMEAAMARIREILRKHPMVDQEDESLVHFVDFGDTSLHILVCYFTKTTVWAEYLKAREEINLAILRLFDELGLKMASPAPVVSRTPGKQPHK